MTRRRIWPALIVPTLIVLTPMVLAPLQAAPPPIVAWSYTVKPGDTIDSVAASMGVSPGDLARANSIGLDTPLVPGTVLSRPDPGGMPGAGRHASVRPALPVRPAPVPVPDRRPEMGPEPAPVHHAAAHPPHLVWPTSGALVIRFGATAHGKPDNGIDLAAFAGMAVHAAAAGKVIFAGTEPERFGQLIVIDHGNGWATAYAYLGKVLVKEGATVRAGSPIARIGATGEAKKPTLHFELRHDNLPQDPLPALPLRL